MPNFWIARACVLFTIIVGGGGCGSVGGAKNDAAVTGSGGAGGGAGGSTDAAASDSAGHGGTTGDAASGGDAATFVVGGDVTGLAGRVVLRNDGGDDLVVTADGPFTFATAVASGAPYAVTVDMQPTTPPQTCTVTNGTGTVANAAVTSVHITCAYPTSCATLHAASPVYGDGMYKIDPDGAAGAVFPVSVYCDMTFGGGGWTLIHAATPTAPPMNMTAGTVTVGSGAYMPTLTMQALATISHQIHIRSPGDPTNRSITSVADSIALTNLRNAMILNFGLPTDATATAAQLAPWTGPFATATTLGFSCVPTGSYPNIYWACGNTSGFHDTGPDTQWSFSGPQEEIDVYLR